MASSPVPLASIACNSIIAFICPGFGWQGSRASTLWRRVIGWKAAARYFARCCVPSSLSLSWEGSVGLHRNSSSTQTCCRFTSAFRFHCILFEINLHHSLLRWSGASVPVHCGIRLSIGRPPRGFMCFVATSHAHRQLVHSLSLAVWLLAAGPLCTVTCRVRISLHHASGCGQENQNQLSRNMTTQAASGGNGNLFDCSACHAFAPWAVT